MSGEGVNHVANQAEPAHLGSGPGRIIIALYGVMALAATGRSSVQIAEYFSRAPLSYVLTALAAVIYIIATICLVLGSPRAARLARWCMAVELVGVLGVGALSYLQPADFPDKTVWSHFGSGYGYLPLVLPFVGLWWVWRQRPVENSAA